MARTLSTGRTARVAAAVAAAVLAVALPVASPAAAAGPPVRLGPAVVERLLGQLTAKEKVRLTEASLDTTCQVEPAGCVGKAWDIGGVPRLDIPPLRFVDGPAGVQLRRPTTAMPAPVALAASFDTSVARAYGATMAREARALDQDVLQAPMVNLVRVPTAGRNFETLGEDPQLAAQLGAAEVRGIQSEAVIAQVKHLAANNFERARGSVSVHVDERTLMETELVPFEAAVRAGAGAAMCAYPRLNDVYACGSSWLLRDVLKGRWRFDGFVRSDAGATHSLSDLVAGMDVQAPPSGGGARQAALLDALANGTPPADATPTMPAQPAISADTWRAALDDAVRRVLTQMDRFGLLAVPYTMGSIDALRGQDAAEAERIAVAGATLLANRKRVLPLVTRGARRGSVLVTGAAALAPVAGGGSSLVIPFPGSATAFDALRTLSGRRSAFRYVTGDDLDGTVLPGWSVLAGPDGLTQGFLRRQIGPGGVVGDVPPPAPPGGAPDAVEPQVDVTGSHTLPAATAWQWTGTLVAPRAGTYSFRLQADHQAAAGLQVGGPGGPRATLGRFPAGGVDGLPQSARTRRPGGMQQTTVTVRLAQGGRYPIELRAAAGAERMHVRLSWVPPGWRAEQIRRAAAAAKKASTAIVFAYDQEAETLDRPSLALPDDQDALIRAVARANPRTVVVLETGAPVTMPWLPRVAGVLEMWYPGQEGGRAAAQVLLGRQDPGGRLPVTFPTSMQAQPTWSPDGARYPGRVLPGHPYPVVDYSEGILTGYRWYQRKHVAPLFPFGAGLSYTRFRYSALALAPRPDGGVDVRFRVRNAGRRTGTDVPQVYVGAPPAPPVQMAPRPLVAFKRVRLKPGRTARVHVVIPSRALSYWSTATHDWAPAPGPREVSVGASSADLRLRGVIG